SQADPAQKAELLDVMRKPRGETTDTDVARVRELYEKLGSVEFAGAEAERLVQQAYETIERIPVADKGFFRQLTRYMVSRTK
ncbi:MAG: hypothetical protein ACYTFZ_06010, partial [Planctomycetota bacterium]